MCRLEKQIALLEYIIEEDEYDIYENFLTLQDRLSEKKCLSLAIGGSFLMGFILAHKKLNKGLLWVGMTFMKF